VSEGNKRSSDEADSEEQSRDESPMKTVLVVEDEPSVMKLLRRMLKQYNVVEATTAQEALLLFIDADYRIDLLVADLTLSSMSGIQVALLVRSKLPAVPVILSSGYSVSDWNSRDTADLHRLGSKSVVVFQKPFRTQALLDTVDEFIGNEPFESEKIA
jgi:CheY-like chemotaxis protein